MDAEKIQQALGGMKTELELIDSTIERKKNRKAELKEFVREDQEINKQIGVLKKRKRELRARFESILDFFKEVGGETPSSILGPLFGQSEEQPLAVEFIGYQELSDRGRYEAMFTLHYSDDRHTSLLKRTLEKRGISVPAHPSFEEWAAQRKQSHECS